MPEQITNPEALTGDAYFDARKEGAKVAVAPATPEPEPPKEPDNAPAPETEGEPAATETPTPEGEAVETPPEDTPQEVQPVDTTPPPKVDPRTKTIRELREQLAERDARDRARDAELARIAAALEARQQPPAPEVKPEPPAAPEPPAQPQRAAFDDPEAYAAAMAEWGAQRALHAYQAEAAKRAEETKAAEDTAAQQRANAERAQQFVSTWNERRAAFIETHPDYQEVAETQTVPINDAMGFVIMNDAKGPEIAYYLGQNPTEAARLSQINPQTNGHELLMEFGALKAKMAAQASASARPQVSRVPAPIVPVGSRSVAAAVDPDTLSGDEYFDRRAPDLQKQRATVGRMN